MTTIFKKFATGTAALVLMTTVFTTTSMAATDDVTTEITGTESPEIVGTISANSFVGPFELTGKDQEITGAAINAFAVTDARGNGAGWQVTVQASQFKDATDVENVKTLTTDALLLSAPEVSKEKEALGSSDLETITRLGGNIGVSPVKVLSAAEGGGMGTFDISAMGLKLNLLPKDVYEGNYTSTVTVSIITGP